MKEKIIQFFKKETVLVVATILAIVSAFFVHPSKKYISYIDFRVLGILLMLMIIMEGLSKNGFFDAIGEHLLSKTKRVWQLAMVLIFLCFFFAMLITNDVALITFVPFAIMMLKKSNNEKLTIPVVVLQTLAANLGSMMTPIGNPQNLYLYNLSGYSIGKFVLIMLPYTAFAGLLLLISILFLKGKSAVIIYEKASKEKVKKLTKRKITVYLLLFIFAIMVVARILPWYYVLIATFLSAYLFDSDILKRVDYCLLLTFIAFFVFTGNMGQIEVINSWLKDMVSGNEVITSVLLSQVISNVPAALLLSGFSNAYEKLMIGVNLGGMGTLIASMASLISFKLLVDEYPNKKGRYFAHFTGISIVYLVLFSGCYFLMKTI